MFNKATKTALASAVVLTAAFGAQSANAALINTFDYTVNSAFTSFTGTGGQGDITPSQPGTGRYASDPTKLSWGTVRGGTTASSPQSSISIDPQVTGTATTNGAASTGATFSHNNRVIPDTSNTLDTFQLNTALNLTAATPASEAGKSPSPSLTPITFSSFFTETENAQPCVSGSQSTCDDIFVLANSSGGVGALGSGQSFTLDGTDYNVQLNIEDLGTLNDDQCTTAGASSGCVGFLTQEGQNNLFRTNFTVTANQQGGGGNAVPEPSDLAMLGLGLGLIGFGIFTRRRKFQA